MEIFNQFLISNYFCFNSFTDVKSCSFNFCLGPLFTSVILMCLLVNVPTTFVSSTGASAVAEAATAAGTSATASPVAPRAPTGISRYRCLFLLRCGS